MYEKLLYWNDVELIRVLPNHVIMYKFWCFFKLKDLMCVEKFHYFDLRDGVDA